MVQFMEFIEKLRKAIKVEARDPKPILVLDNHSAHKSKARRKIMSEFC